MSKVFSEVLTLYCDLIALKDAVEANKTRAHYAHAFGKENAEFMKNMKELIMSEHEQHRVCKNCNLCVKSKAYLDRYICMNRFDPHAPEYFRPTTLTFGCNQFEEKIYE